MNIIVQRSESARARRSGAPREQRHPRLGPEHSAGSESPVRPRLRSGDDVSSSTTSTNGSGRRGRSSRAPTYCRSSASACGFDIGLPRERQLLAQRLDLGRGRAGDKQRAESMKQLGTSSIPNPMGMIPPSRDSLFLTRVQADSLATLSHSFAVFADSIWTPVSRLLRALPDVYSQGEAYSRYVSARERTVDYLLTLVADAKGVLTASQRRRLPPQISNYLDERVLKFLRSSSAGDNSRRIHTLTRVLRSAMRGGIVSAAPSRTRIRPCHDLLESSAALATMVAFTAARATRRHSPSAPATATAGTTAYGAIAVARRIRLRAQHARRRDSRREDRAGRCIRRREPRHGVHVDHRDADGSIGRIDRQDARRNGDRRAAAQRAVVPRDDAARQPDRSQGNERRLSWRRERNADAARARCGANADRGAVGRRRRSPRRRSRRGSAPVQLLVPRRHARRRIPRDSSS